MHRALTFCICLLLGVALACGGETLDEEDARATVEAVVSRVSATLTAEDAAPQIAPPTPDIRLPTAMPATIAPISTSAPPTPTPAPAPTDTDAPGSRGFRSLDNGEYLEQSEPQAAEVIKNLPWIADGISDSELESAEYLTQMAAFYQPLFWTLVEYPWVQDGLSDSESPVLRGLLIVVQRSAGAAEHTARLSWLGDAVDDRESAAIRQLALISQVDASAVSRIVAMPFMQSVEAHDLPALRSLQLMANTTPQSFERVMGHPTVGAGITDAWTPVIATLQGVSRTNPALIDVLLDPNRITVESRVVNLPLSGPAPLSIIRTRPGAARSMDLLETALMNSEAFMGAPFPEPSVTLLFDLAVAGSAAGTNFGTHMAIRPKFDVDDGSHEAETAGHIIAHEVAHYYWSNNADWIDEGSAELIASASENARAGRPLDATNYPCPYARDIAAIEALGAAPESEAYLCNYSLGERMLLDMYQRLGDAAFRQGFRDLYRKSTVEDGLDQFAGAAMGIGDLRDSFGAAGDPDAVERVVGRWYDGSVPFDAVPSDGITADPSLPTIDGRLDRSFVSRTQLGQPLTQWSVQDFTGPALLVLEYAYNPLGQQRTVHLEIVESFQDGFIYRRRGTSISAQSGFTGGRQWLQIGPPAGEPWAAGWHRVQVYEGGRKVADAQYTVTP